MAQATLPHHSIARPTRKLDPARVVQSYLHIVDTQGKRGALRKTGEIYSISDETVRRYVAAHEAAQNPPEIPQDLQYIPPPYSYPEPIMPTVSASYVASLVTEQPQEETPVRDFVMSRDIATTEAAPGETANTTAENDTPEIDTHHTFELEEAGPELNQMPQLAVFGQRSTTLDLDQRLAAPTIIRERVYIRERQEVGLLAWAIEHPGLAHQMVALLIVTGLILLCRLA